MVLVVERLLGSTESESVKACDIWLADFDRNVTRPKVTCMLLKLLLLTFTVIYLCIVRYTCTW
jgi:hypothetical protein